MKTRIWHPSEVWDWYRENLHHKEGGCAFVSFPDHKRAIVKIKKDYEKMCRKYSFAKSCALSGEVFTNEQAEEVAKELNETKVER